MLLSLNIAPFDDIRVGCFGDDFLSNYIDELTL